MTTKNTTDKSDDEKAKDAEPKPGEPGFVYNDDGAEIQNPGPKNDPLIDDDKPIGWRQLGDRVVEKPDPETINRPSGDEVNLGDKDGGKPLTPKEPGSTSR